MLHCVHRVVQGNVRRRQRVHHLVDKERRKEVDRGKGGRGDESQGIPTMIGHSGICSGLPVHTCTSGGISHHTAVVLNLLREKGSPRKNATIG